MKTKPSDDRAAQERALEDAKQQHVAPEPTKHGAHGKPVSGGAPETPESRATFPKRTEKPGHAGLANEARPGLGTRGDDPNAGKKAEAPPREAKSRAKPRATKRGYEEPPPAPREQAPDTLEHEQERSTGVSGHSGGT
jgi:hypothetical protein